MRRARHTASVVVLALAATGCAGSSPAGTGNPTGRLGDPSGPTPVEPGQPSGRSCGAGLVTHGSCDFAERVKSTYLATVNTMGHLGASEALAVSHASGRVSEVQCGGTVEITCVAVNDSGLSTSFRIRPATPTGPAAARRRR